MNKQYKNFGIYVNGLKRLIAMRNERMPSYKIRIFIDKSIADDKYIMSILKSDKNIQIVKYTCPNYMETNKYYHRGTFGTLVRFFPMFDFENNDANLVIVSDIELNKNDTEVMIKISKSLHLFKNKLAFMYYSNIFLSEFLNLNKKYIFAGRLFNTTRLPKSSIINFMENINNVVVDNPLYQGKGEPNNENIRYGIDETYLNKYLLKDLDESGIRYGFYTKYNISNFFYYFRDKVLSHPDSEKYLKMILGDSYMNNKDVSENLTLLDLKTFAVIENKILPIPDDTIEIIKNYSKFLFYLDENKIYNWMSQRMLKYLIKNCIGVLHNEGYYDSNDNKVDIVKAVSIDPTHDDKILYVKKNVSIYMNYKNNSQFGGSNQSESNNESYYKYKYQKYKSKYLNTKKLF